LTLQSLIVLVQISRLVEFLFDDGFDVWLVDVVFQVFVELCSVICKVVFDHILYLIVGYHVVGCGIASRVISGGIICLGKRILNDKRKC